MTDPWRVRLQALAPRFAPAPGLLAASCAVAAAWLVLAGLVALLLWNAWQSEIREAKLRGGATTALLQSHTANTFRAVDNALLDMARSLQSARIARHDPRFRETTQSRLPAMPYVRALYVIGPDGFILHDTDHPATPDVSLADRPYFRQYVTSDVPPSPVSAPILSRSGTGWFVAVTRRIGTADDFRGVAVAAIQLRYFAALYREVGLGDGSQILLFHRDGTLIAQFPDSAGTIGAPYGTYPLFRTHLRTAPAGAYLSDGAPLPYPRVVNYAAVPDMPLVVAQTQNLQGRMDRWKKVVLFAALGMLLLLGASLYATAQYLGVRLARQRTQERLVQGEKMEALGQLTGGIAHDFANILGLVTTNIELLKRTRPGDGRFEAALARATKALDNGTSLTRQLMSFARKRDLQITEVDLNVAVTGVLPLLEHAAGPQCKLAFEPTAGLHRCRVDCAQLETALINLVVNARHALEGTGTITISTSDASRHRLRLAARVRGRPLACVTVTDSGKGMPEEVRRRAVEPFFTTKGEQGTGLGLAQVFSLMEQLGGELVLDSKVGEGTAVHLCFPAAPAASAGSPSA